MPEISADLIRAGRAPDGHRFEVCDDTGRLVFELPFSDVLGTRSVRPTEAPDALHAQLTATVQRSRALRAEMNATLAEVKTTLRTTRRLLASRG